MNRPGNASASPSRHATALTRVVSLTHPRCVDVFVSYASEDRAWARELISHLEEKGLNVSDPASELSPGDNWSLEIGKALEGAGAMVVLVSPASARSESAQRDLDYALGSKKFRDRLIPVIVKPTDKVPWILRRLDPVKGTPSQASERIAKRLKRSVVSCS